MSAPDPGGPVLVLAVPINDPVLPALHPEDAALVAGNLRILDGELGIVAKDLRIFDGDLALVAENLRILEEELGILDGSLRILHGELGKAGEDLRIFAAAKQIPFVLG